MALTVVGLVPVKVLWLSVLSSMVNIKKQVCDYIKKHSCDLGHDHFEFYVVPMVGTSVYYHTIYIPKFCQWVL